MPRGPRPCRSGGVSSAALRPACACDRAGRPAAGPLAVSRRSLRSGGSIDTPPRDARSGPARSGAIGLRPLGGLGHPTPRLVEAFLLGFGSAGALGLQHHLRLVGGGVVNPPVLRVAIRSCARGSRTGEPRRGVAAAASCGPRGAPARIALSGRGRRSMRARARGRPGPHPATRGTGKKDSTEWKMANSTRATRPRPAGQNKKTSGSERRNDPSRGSRPSGMKDRHCQSGCILCGTDLDP